MVSLSACWEAESAAAAGSPDRTPPAVPASVCGGETMSHEFVLDVVGGGVAAASSSSASLSTVGDHEDDDADEVCCGTISCDCTCCSSSRILSRIWMAFLLSSNAGLLSL